MGSPPWNHRLKTAFSTMCFVSIIPSEDLYSYLQVCLFYGPIYVGYLSRHVSKTRPDPTKSVSNAVAQIAPAYFTLIVIRKLRKTKAIKTNNYLKPSKTTPPKKKKKKKTFKKCLEPPTNPPFLTGAPAFCALSFKGFQCIAGIRGAQGGRKKHVPGYEWL